jgi:hypothetical protein
MILLVALLVLSIVAVVGTVVTVLRDGYRARPTVPSRIPDRDPAPSTPRVTGIQEKSADRAVPALRARRVS